MNQLPFQNRLVFVASPYTADSEAKIKQNQQFAIDFIKNLWYYRREVGFAPHIYFPQVLCDENTDERQAGIESGLKVMRICDCVYLLGDHLSKGMQKEMEYAEAINKPIIKVACPQTFFGTKI